MKNKSKIVHFRLFMTVVICFLHYAYDYLTRNKQLQSLIVNKAKLIVLKQYSINFWKV